MPRLLSALLAVLALIAIAVAVERIAAAREGVSAEHLVIANTPTTLYRPAAGFPAGNPPPLVVIAHGFAGSRTLMAPFAIALARNGYLALAFDFVGHGEHPRPMSGDVNSVDGPTQTMIAQVGEMADHVLAETGSSRLAVLGHSMASDIVVRYAIENPSVGATIAVSMFSPAVTDTAPRNLLVIVGDWEGVLKDEALRAVGLATAPDPAEAGVTYGDFAQGTARRASFSAQSEHVAVLFNEESLVAAVEWLDQSFGIQRDRPIAARSVLPWIGLLTLGILVLAYPLARWLPVLSQPPAGAGLGWRTLWPVVVIPTVAVPLTLRLLPTDFLPIVVGDYLAVHFLAFGLVTAALTAWMGRSARAARQPPKQRAAPLAIAVVTLAVTAYTAGALGLAIETTITNYHPVPARFPLFAAMLCGTLVYFLASEWATHGESAGRFAPAAEKLGFVLSLAIAVALDFERLFFLIIIVPIIALYFVIYGVFSRWSYRATGHPVPGAVASAIAFAWGMTVTFPMLSG